MISALTLFRFFYAPTLELVADEAYYWLWSKNLDMCYYSKGPGVAWTIAAGTWLWGDSVFGIRFFAVLLSAGTGYWLFRLGTKLFDARTGFWALVVAALIPLYSVGSILMTIDPLSLFFWVLSAYSFWWAKDQDRLAPWLLTGLWVGLGMLCKYTNVALIISFALFCLWSAPHRRQLMRPMFWLMTAVSFLSLLPVALWNARHGWVTLRHLQERGRLTEEDPFRFRINELTQFITEQALVISPLLLVCFVTAAILILKGIVRAKQPDEDSVNALTLPVWKFLLTLFLPLPVFYFVLSINEAGEANWPAPAYLGGALLLAGFTLNRAGTRFKRLVQAALILALVQTVLFHFSSLIPLHKWGIADPMDRVRGHHDLARNVSALQQQYGAAFIIARKYQTASLLSYYLPDQQHVYFPSSDRVENQFSFWPGYSEMMPNEFSALFVCEGKAEPRPSIYKEFSSVHLIREFYTTYRGRNVQLYRVFYLDNYLGPIAPEKP